MGIDIFYRTGGMFMTGPGNIGIHIVLGKADLPADFIGMDFAFANQIVNGGLADMKDVSHLLGGQRFVLCQVDPSLQRVLVFSKMYYTPS